MVFKKILIAIDNSPLSIRTAELGHSLSQKLNATIALVHVIHLTPVIGGGEVNVTSTEFVEELRKEGKELMNKTARHLGDAKISTFLPEGKPFDEILKIAEEWNAGIIVMGSHGHTGVKRLVLGSVAEHVLRHSKCPVFIVPPVD